MDFVCFSFFPRRQTEGSPYVSLFKYTPIDLKVHRPPGRAGDRARAHLLHQILDGVLKTTELHLQLLIVPAPVAMTRFWADSAAPHGPMIC